MRKKIFHKLKSFRRLNIAADLDLVASSCYCEGQSNAAWWVAHVDSSTANIRGGKDRAAQKYCESVSELCHVKGD